MVAEPPTASGNVVLSGLVPEHGAAVLEVEVPLVEARVGLVHAFGADVTRDDEAARLHDGEHVAEDRQRVVAVVERVARVGDVERLRAELAEQLLARAELRPDRRSPRKVSGPAPTSRIATGSASSSGSRSTMSGSSSGASTSSRRR
jgi:hypothetical protein